MLVAAGVKIAFGSGATSGWGASVHAARELPFEAETAAGRDLSVNSTPTLIVNGEIVRGVPDWGEFDAIVRAAAVAASEGA